MLYKLAIAGGTFDRLHEGHKAFLRTMFTQAEKIILGITSDEYAAQKPEGKIQSLQDRESALKTFLQNEGVLEKVKIVVIHNVFGVLLEKNISPDVLFVTQDTKGNGEIINAKREELGLLRIPLVVVPLVHNDQEQVISSTAIRSGVMNNNGKIWIKPAWYTHTLRLPDELRPDLSRPFGPVVSRIPDIDPLTTIVVGDETTRLFNQQGRQQHVSIVDFFVERKKQYASIQALGFDDAITKHHLHNEHGHVDWHAWEVIRSSLLDAKNRSVIRVLGEEDLLVLPVILLAPLGNNIFYGQPGQGMVWIKIEEGVKEHATSLLDRFI